MRVPPKRGRPVTGLARTGPGGFPLEQINFRCSREMAKRLIQAAKKAGGIRQFIAGLMRDAGHKKVPVWDTEEAPIYRHLPRSPAHER